MMRLLITAILACSAFASACSTTPTTSKSKNRDSVVSPSASPGRYDCGTYSDGLLVQLPIAPMDAPVSEVTIVFPGERMKATYVRNGLQQIWYLSGEQYIELKPTMSAMYYDFTGAEEVEERRTEAMFTTCTKREY